MYNRKYYLGEKIVKHLIIKVQKFILESKSCFRRNSLTNLMFTSIWADKDLKSISKIQL